MIEIIEYWQQKHSEELKQFRITTDHARTSGELLVVRRRTGRFIGSVLDGVQCGRCAVYMEVRRATRWRRRRSRRHYRYLVGRRRWAHHRQRQPIVTGVSCLRPIAAAVQHDRYHRKIILIVIIIMNYDYDYFYQDRLEK